MKSRQQLQAENLAMDAIGANMKANIFLLVTILVFVYLILAIVLWQRFHHYPESAFIATSDAQAVCAPIGLADPQVSDATARDFAVKAVRAIQTYDWSSWRDQINSSTAQYMTLKGRQAYRLSVSDWGIIANIVENYQNSLTSIAPYTQPEIQTRGVVEDMGDDGRMVKRYEWQVLVPLTLTYKNQKSEKSENRNFIATVVRVPKSPLSPKGIAIGRLVSTQPVNEAGAISGIGGGAPAQGGAGQ